MLISIDIGFLLQTNFRPKYFVEVLKLHNSMVFVVVILN